MDIKRYVKKIERNKEKREARNKKKEERGNGSKKIWK